MNKLKIKVVKNSNKFFVFSAVIILVCLGSIFTRGFNLGIDFAGGTIIQIDLHTKFKTSDVKEIINEYDKTADITYLGSNKQQVAISTKLDLNEQQRNDIFKKFQDKYNIEQEDLLAIDNVDASIGKEMQSQMFIASIITVLCILVYITFRFEFWFGITAIAALVHDLIVVLGVYSIFQVQVNASFIAAILTILGYSINDTIVVFDRVRENRSKYASDDLVALVDDSINQTLTRSINTTLTTLIAITPLFILGGASIKEFIFPLLVGFIFGVYSTIFISTTLWYKIQVKRGNKSKIKVKKK